MLLLVALVSQAAPPPPKVRATATVRIERAASASRERWEQLPLSSKREVIVRDAQGRPVLLRLVEYQ